MEKRKHLQQTMLTLLNVNMYKNENRSISILKHETQVQMVYRPHYKSYDTESDRRECGKYLLKQGHQRPLPEA